MATKLCRTVVNRGLIGRKTFQREYYADFYPAIRSNDTRACESLYLSHILWLNWPHIYRFRSATSSLANNTSLKHNTSEGATFRVSCKRSRIMQTRSDQPHLTIRATLTLRYGTFLCRARIYKRERFSISLSLWRKQRHLNCKNKALLIVVSSISQRIQITRLSELLLHEQ